MLEIGLINESVTVTADAPVLEITTAPTGQVINTRAGAFGPEAGPALQCRGPKRINGTITLYLRSFGRGSLTGPRFFLPVGLFVPVGRSTVQACSVWIYV